MRRLIIAFIVLFAAGFASQNISAAKPEIENIFNELSIEPGATKVSINSFATWLGKMFLGNSPEEMLAKKTKAINILAFEQCNNTTHDKIMKRLGKLTTDGYEEMIRVNDDGDKVTIFANIDKEIIHRLVIVALSSEDCVLIDIKGKFDLNEIGQLVNSHTAKGNDGQ